MKNTELYCLYINSINSINSTNNKGKISFTKNVKNTAERSDLRNNIKLRFIDSYKVLASTN